MGRLLLILKPFMLLDPTILFFVLGIAAGLLRSNLDIPAAVSRFLSLYLLMALGLKGGFALADSGLTRSIFTSLSVAVLMAFLVPLIGYVVLKRLTNSFDAAAIAAAYGSVSAVTFITATQVGQSQGLADAGHMAVALVLMETPAIIVALMLAVYIRSKPSAKGAATGLPAGSTGRSGATEAPIDQPADGEQGVGMKLGHLLKESLTDGSQMILLGALAIGLITGKHGETMMQPFAGDIFKGMLALFLLDMGLNVARRMRAHFKVPTPLIVYSVISPFVHASLVLGFAYLLGLPATDTFLLMVLSASASYIVVPAVLRDAMPEANSAWYLGLSLAVTFPLNVLVGIPVYLQAVKWTVGF